MLYLGGGGSEYDGSQLWDLVFSCPGQRVTVWPYAMPQSKIPKTMKWITQALKKRRIPPVAIGDRAPDFGLSTSDVLAIPGGNTFDSLT